MFKFNNNHIVTGHIKQLLASVNLPTCKIYTTEHKQYRAKHGTESPEILYTIKNDKILQQPAGVEYPADIRYVPYLKDNKLQRYVKNADGSFTWEVVNEYGYDVARLNYTKNLKIRNNIYDTYTHEYLGDYLRFLRDYHDIDLMPLYNCFNDKLCSNLVINCEHEEVDETGAVLRKKHFLFNAADDHFKIYMLPVKLFKEYTIALDCDTQVEICCGIYGKYLDEEYTKLLHDTYTCMGGLSFNQPVLYTKLKDLAELNTDSALINLSLREDDLKLFIKVPIDNTSSIVILEGNYLGWNDRLFTVDDGKKMYYANHSVMNLEAIDKFVGSGEADEAKFMPITTLQLLQMNTGENYPFANRLVEYLLDNVVYPLDTLPDNIIRVKQAITNNNILQLANENNEIEGIWDERIRPILYGYMQQADFVRDTDGKIVSDSSIKCNKNIAEANHDILGYADKDVEKFYQVLTRYGNYVSLMNLDIYPDLYKADK